MKGDIAMKAVVIRDGGEETILAREIVPGDIVSAISQNTLRALTLYRWSSRKANPFPLTAD